MGQGRHRGFAEVFRLHRVEHQGQADEFGIHRHDRRLPVPAPQTAGVKRGNSRIIKALAAFYLFSQNLPILRFYNGCRLFKATDYFA